MASNLKIDLACGPHRKEGFIRVDIHEPYAPDIVADIRGPIPGLNNCCASEVHCWHVLEHLHGYEWRSVIDEIARLLQREGVFEIRVPHPADENSMIHDHVSVLTPYWWRQMRDDDWLHKALIITEVHERINPRCAEHCAKHNLDFEAWAPFLRNAFTETIIKGYKP